MQDVGPVDDNGGEEKRAEEPEVGVAENSEKERLILAHQLDLLPEIADEVRAEFLFGCSGRNAVDAKAGAESDASEREEHIAGIDFVAMEALGHCGAGDGADDDGEERAEFDDAISPGEALCREQLREQAVLRWPEERSLRGDQTERDKRQGAHVQSQTGGGDASSRRSPSPWSRW